MNRCLVFLCALFCAFITVSSAVAEPLELVRFTLDSSRNDGKLRGSFHTENRGRSTNNWSTGLMPSELIGLDVAGFRASGTRPVGFAVVRDAGRLDCTGRGGSGHASGDCRFNPDASFNQMLAARGIGRPSREQSYALMAIGARRELIDAVAAAGYPAPSIDNLIALAALGVDARYIRDLARVGFRPRTISSLVEFKALGITPDWIAGFTRIGYADASPGDLVQMKALGITPDFVAGFESLGYGRLPVTTLVQFKALNITPGFVRSAVGRRSTRPTIDELVHLRLFGRR
ncbi:MAG TPA: hypothetical protein VJ597_07000 [Sphingomicrobium sp.]|nr:hypothetical protein [Sphingomicrobium sp.]